LSDRGGTINVSCLGPFEYDELSRNYDRSFEQKGAFCCEGTDKWNSMANKQPVISRRNLLKSVAGPSAAAMLLPPALWNQERKVATEQRAQTGLLLPVLSQPDMMLAFVGDVEASRFELSRSGTDWTSSAGGVKVGFVAADRHSTISLESPTSPIQRVHLRWKCKFPPGVLALGDVWERSYGDLEWRPLQAERVMPWYAMLHVQGQTAGMGVKTGAASFVFWQADSAGISLWLDVRNGGNGVWLGSRRLHAATIVQCAADAGESAFSTTQRLCRLMAEGTRVPEKRGTTFVNVIYGSNDWYYAYGKTRRTGSCGMPTWSSPSHRPQVPCRSPLSMTDIRIVPDSPIWRGLLRT
jgi:alpha-galactosidase